MSIATMGRGKSRAQALQSCRADLERERVRLSTAGEWLVLDARVGTRVTPSKAWDFVRAHSILANPAKLARSAGDTLLGARIDVPIEDDADLEHGIRRALSHLNDARALVKRGADLRAHAAAGEGEMVAELARLLETARELEWRCEERDSASFGVDLEPKGPPRKVIVESHEDSVRFSTVLDRSEPPQGACRAALGMLLLGANQSLRFARGFITDSADSVEATDSADFKELGFEVRLPTGISPRELDHALRALAVANRRWRREVAALHDGDLARRWLELRGFQTNEGKGSPKARKGKGG